MNTIRPQFLKIIDRRSQYRRKHPRAAVTWPATVISNNKTTHGRVGNISRGGALLYLAEQFECRSSIRIAIEIPDCHDVITAHGTVVRSLLLKKEDDQQFSYGVAIEFTKISEKDLRFFSGNLAPEWQENYVDPHEMQGPSRTHYEFMKYSAFCLFIVCISSLIYFIPKLHRQDAVDSRQIVQLDEKLKNLESQLHLLQTANVSLQNIEEKIDLVKYDMSNVKNKISDIEPFAKKMEQADNTSQKPAPESHAVDEGPKPLKIVPAEKIAAHPHVVYHVVKSGENLYRIGLKYGLTPAEIRTLNNLHETSPIVPGQRLTVK